MLNSSYNSSVMTSSALPGLLSTVSQSAFGLQASGANQLAGLGGQQPMSQYAPQTMAQYPPQMMGQYTPQVMGQQTMMMSPYAGMYARQMPPNQYFYPQPNCGMPPQQQQGGGDTRMLTALIGQMMQLFVMAIMSGKFKQNAGSTETPPEETGETEGSEGSSGSEETSGDPQLESIAGEDANSNSGALVILDVYADQLPTKNGKVTLKELKKFAKSPPEDVPEEVAQAAQTVVDNPELYHLLCLKSGSTPEKGFKVSVLDTDWSTTKIDIDNLESVEDNYSAAKELKKVITPLLELNGSEYDFTFDDLKDIALGKVSNSKLKDPAVQAAALMFLSDPDAMAELSGDDDEIISSYNLDNFIKDNK